MAFVPYDSSKYDFSKAANYRKTATIKESQIEIADKAQEVITMINGKEETRNTAQEGDYIITGVKGERYALKKINSRSFMKKTRKTRIPTYLSACARRCVLMRIRSFRRAGAHRISKRAVWSCWKMTG